MISGCGWDVIFAVVKCHVTELTGEVDLRDSPWVGAKRRI